MESAIIAAASAATATITKPIGLAFSAAFHNHCAAVAIPVVPLKAPVAAVVPIVAAFIAVCIEVPISSA